MVILTLGLFFFLSPLIKVINKAKLSVFKLVFNIVWWSSVLKDEV